MTPPEPHDDERCARLYRACKRECVGFARKVLASSQRQNPYLCAFDAEEFYDGAWESYYTRQEYLEERDDHVARINALIVSRFRDELRKSRAQKRTLPGRPATIDEADSLGASGRPGTRRGWTSGAAASSPGAEDDLADRDELRQLLSAVANPDDSRALIDHELRGLTYEEIGESEGITAEAARRRAQRAKAEARRRRDER